MACWGSSDQIKVPPDYTRDVAAVSTAIYGHCALSSSGGIGCWGTDNGWGETIPPPALQSGLTGLACGGTRTCVLQVRGLGGMARRKSISCARAHLPCRAQDPARAPPTPKGYLLGCWGAKVGTFWGYGQDLVPSGFSSGISAIAQGRGAHSERAGGEGRAWGVQGRSRPARRRRAPRPPPPPHPNPPLQCALCARPTAR